jgi:2,3-bisphosphoglycerate-independent phosphoglycerate mutase
LGYNPQDLLTGRGPLEAASLGVKLWPTDVAYRCNLVTLAYSNATLLMDDYSAGHISTEEARILIKDLDRKIGSHIFQFYSGVSYRHIMVWQNGQSVVDTTPPHDITGQPVQKYLDRMKSHENLLQLMQQASHILKDHPVNRERIKRGEKPANNVWFWGQGYPLNMPLFKKRTGLRGAIISAVDLLKGIGIYAGLDVINVPGATGYLDTNYEGKAKSCLQALKKVDLVYLHVEAPDEASHEGHLDEKIRAIEAFDEKVVGRILDGMKRFSTFRIMVITDHYTPISVKTHTREPVPFAIFGTDRKSSGLAEGFNEKTAKKGPFIKMGEYVIDRFIGKS